MTLHGCPNCVCDTGEAFAPRPSQSSPGIRRLALEATERAIREAKESRKKPAEEATR